MKCRALKLYDAPDGGYYAKVISIVALPSVVAAVSCLWIGWILFQQDRASPVNQWFSLLCLCFALWSFSVVGDILSDGTSSDEFWERMQYFWACVYSPTGLMFFFALSGGLPMLLRKPYLLALLLLPVAVMEVANLGWGLVNPRHGNHIWFIAHHSLAGCIALFGAVLTLRWAKRTELKRERLQARWLAWWTIACVPVAVFMDFTLDPFRYPSQSSLVPFVWVLGAYYAVRRFGLLTLTPANAAHFLMEGIEEYTFLIDPEARVVELNRSAIVLFGSGGETGSKRLLESLFADADGLRAKLEGLRNSGASQLESGVVALKEDEGTTLLRASFHLVRDKWGDAVGYVAIARDWDQIAAVSSRYRLSERESQVLSFILSGVQQKEMADQLCLSLPTIKSHTTSLYNKLGVGSRGEVWALCASDDKPAPARVL